MLEVLVTCAQAATMARLAGLASSRDGGPVGPPATITRLPGQVRKEAAKAGTLCAGVWLAGPPPFPKSLILKDFLS